jgi:hypothetical protein
MGKMKLTLDQPARYEILIPGIMNVNWMDWYEGIIVNIKDEGQDNAFTTLRITLDQAGLQGLLRHLYALGLPLISVVWIDYER